MKYAHSIKLTAFSYENENSELIRKAFLEFFPFDLAENKVALKISIAAFPRKREVALNIVKEMFSK